MPCVPAIIWHKRGKQPLEKLPPSPPVSLILTLTFDTFFNASDALNEHQVSEAFLQLDAKSF